MSQPTITGFMIALILGGLMVGLYTITLTSMSSKYDLTDQGYSNGTLDKFNKLNEMRIEAESAKNNITEIKQEPNAADLLGSMFSNAYVSLRLVARSFDVFYSMAADSFADTLGLGQAGELLQSALLAIVMILLFIGVLLAAIIKRDL